MIWFEMSMNRFADWFMRLTTCELLGYAMFLLSLAAALLEYGGLFDYLLGIGWVLARLVWGI